MQNANTVLKKELTGYPSIDKPWLKYYSEEAIHAPLPECTIYEYLWENNINHLDDIALIYFGKKITYKQMFKQIEKAANAFSTIGISEGDVIGMCVANTPEAVYCFYAANKIGAVCNMLDLRSSVEDFKNLFTEIKCKYAVVLDVCLEQIKPIAEDITDLKIIVISPFTSLPFPLNLKVKKVPKKPNFISYRRFMTNNIKSAKLSTHCLLGKSLAVIAHTGGTTGNPKGVMISNQSMICVAIEYKMSGMPMQRGERFLTMVPPFILNGLCTCLNLPLTCGVACILIPSFEQEKFPQYLKMKPEHIIAAPSWWERLAEDKQMNNFDLSFIVTAATGGDGISVKNEKTVN